jgi:hypothetical protein
VAETAIGRSIAVNTSKTLPGSDETALSTTLVLVKIIVGEIFAKARDNFWISFDMPRGTDQSGGDQREKPNIRAKIVNSHA